MIHMFKDFLETADDEEVRSISRRYFLSNGFDGTLTATGIAVGSYLSGVGSGLTVFKVGVGAAIGLATSGVWSVWEIERAEKMAELREKEDAMLEDLEDTKLREKQVKARKINAAMSGLGPILGVLLPISTFLLPIPLLYSAIGSILVGAALLSVFGVYMADISDQSKIISAVRMGIAGFVVAALNYILPG